VDPAAVVTLDLATTSDVYDFAFEDDGSLRADIEDELASAAVQSGARLVVTRYGQARLSRTRKLSQQSPDVVATGISLWPASATPVIALGDGEIEGSTLRGAQYELTLSGVDAVASGGVRAGEPVAEAPPGTRVEVGVRPVGAPEAPPFTIAELAPGWLALTR